MKKIILYGAFDRYNYGDNIMPILFEMFIEKYAQHILTNFVIEYAAISDSNLEQYCCQKTKNINCFTDALPKGSALVVIGGEVLCAQNQSLYLHMQDNSVHHLILKVFNKLLPSVFKEFVKSRYSSYWEYPFIPPSFPFFKNVNIIYNTVGGDIKNLSSSQLTEIKNRFDSAAYISVRDKRTLNQVSPLYADTQLAPDSAYIMSDLLQPSILRNRVSDRFCSLLPYDYYVFQAAPSKVGCTLTQLISIVSDLAKQSQKKIVLLPIGYASGHDDYHLLRKVHKALSAQTILVYDLTIWEIMYTIQNAKVFFGTSLHGVITAMSYNIPHFGINPKVTKLNAFLQEWSIAPFNQCYEVNEIVGLPAFITEKNIIDFQRKSQRSIEQVKDNFHRILGAIKSG